MDAYYGYALHFHTWKEYIDSAIATGMMNPTRTLELLDPSKPNHFGHPNTTGGPPGSNDFEYARGAGGYNIILAAVNNIINAGFSEGWVGQTPCETWVQENGSSTSNCDRTFSTPCG